MSPLSSVLLLLLFSTLHEAQVAALDQFPRRFAASLNVSSSSQSLPSSSSSIKSPVTTVAASPTGLFDLVAAAAAVDSASADATAPVAESYTLHVITPSLEPYLIASPSAAASTDAPWASATALVDILTRLETLPATSTVPIPASTSTSPPASHPDGPPSMLPSMAESQPMPSTDRGNGSSTLVGDEALTASAEEAQQAARTAAQQKQTALAAGIAIPGASLIILVGGVYYMRRRRIMGRAGSHHLTDEDAEKRTSALPWPLASHTRAGSAASTRSVSSSGLTDALLPRGLDTDDLDFFCAGDAAGQLSPARGLGRARGRSSVLQSLGLGIHTVRSVSPAISVASAAGAGPWHVAALSGGDFVARPGSLGAGYARLSGAAELQGSRRSGGYETVPMMRGDRDSLHSCGRQ